MIILLPDTTFIQATPIIFGLFLEVTVANAAGCFSTKFFILFRLSIILKSGGDDVRNFEPKRWLNFAVIDKSIKELRAIYKVHPEWFETPHPESDRGKNEVDYSIIS